MTMSGDPSAWAIIAIGAAFTAWTFVAAIYWIARPGETNPDHPKNLILKDER
ncbi:MAG TPA: hypothetical protein VGG51_09265 [Candidatus Cybelea sp.]|jgi:hypothetical protein